MVIPVIVDLAIVVIPDIVVNQDIPATVENPVIQGTVVNPVILVIQAIVVSRVIPVIVAPLVRALIKGFGLIILLEIRQSHRPGPFLSHLQLAGAQGR